MGERGRLLRLGRHRSEVEPWPQRVDREDHLVDEALRDGRFDVDALDRRAALPGVRERAPYDAAHGAIEVRVGEHDGRVFPAQLERAGRHPLGACVGDLAPRRDAPREDDEIDVRGRERLPHVGPAVREHEDVFRDEPVEQIEDRLPRARRHLARLPHDRVAREEGGHERAERERHRIVPGRDERDDAAWVAIKGTGFAGIKTLSRSTSVTSSNSSMDSGPVVDSVRR